MPTTWFPPVELPDLSAAKFLSIDLESKDPLLNEKGPGTFRKDNKIVGVAINTGDGYKQYFPVGHDHGQNLDKGVVFSWLKEELGRASQPKIGARLLYDMELLWAEGVTVRGPKYDIQVAEALLDENKFRYNLDSIAEERLGKKKLNADLIRAAAKYKIKPEKVKQHMNIYLPEEVAPYALEDTELPLQIWAQQEQELRDQDLWPLFSEIEVPLLDCLLAMRIKGVPIDVAKAVQVGDKLKEDEEALREQLRRETGIEIQEWAAESIAVAFDKAAIPYPRTPKTNAPSFTQEWLAVHPAPLAKAILELRRLNRMRNVFIQNSLLGNVVNGRLHTQFHSVKHDDGGTVSGRFSSSDPNLQQIPSRHPVYGPLIRGLYIPEHGCRWCKCDYSQQEPRVTVHYAYVSGMPGAIEARDRYIRDPNTDYHTYVAELCACERRLAKDINLGLAYGMGIPKMALKLGLPVNETKVLFDTYHANVKYMKPLAQRLISLASTRGYIKTILGRRRRFDKWLPPGYQEQKVAPLAYDAAVERWGLPLKRAFTHKALNGLIQGSSADMVKKAMVDYFSTGNVPHLTVHDELDDSITSGKQAAELKEIMLNAIKLEVPLKVDMFIEDNWGKCK